MAIDAPTLDATRRLGTLEDVLRWARAQSPPLEIVEVVTQDEFTHDVVFAARDGWLVFDTT
ncbi:MAG: hypothetical protein EXR72_10720 [Myxococcales bacterium]|nr:hypothetical protein [Myxococcales bacterium]